MHTLCFDFGNTRMKVAVFNGEKFIESLDLNEGDIHSVHQLKGKYSPLNIIVSTVVSDQPELENLLKGLGDFHVLTNQSKLNYKIAIQKAETIGTDRLALAAAAVRFFPGKNNLIISLGTCITYNFINQYGLFLGGAISPGMDMRFRSMHELTAKLPLVKGEWTIPLIGYDTKTALQSGVILGIISEIKGFIEQYEARYANFNVVLTGGNSTYFASQLKNKIFADPNFLFKGLYALSEINNSPV